MPRVSKIPEKPEGHSGRAHQAHFVGTVETINPGKQHIYMCPCHQVTINGQCIDLNQYIATLVKNNRHGRVEIFDSQAQEILGIGEKVF